MFRAALLASLTASATASISCSGYEDCTTCTSQSHLLGEPSDDANSTLSTTLFGCRWCPQDNSCHKDGSLFNPCSSSESVSYFDVCPVPPEDYPGVPDFLPDWMANLMPVISDLTLLDLSLPGTHDTLTYDLSTTVSDAGIDDYDELSKILHLFSGLIPGQIEDFIRQQAKTQALSITQQLDNGVRFLDFRNMQESSGDWYSLHCLQSNNPSLTYLKEIRAWMDLHPSEIVVMWVSKHGDQNAVGDNAYPGVSAEDKQAYFAQLLDVFSGLVIDTAVSQPNSTSVSDLIARNHRLVPYVSDYAEFTGGSQYAMDGALVDNNLGSSVDGEEDAYNSEMAMFGSMKDLRAADKARNALYLRSMATSSPDFQVEAVAMMKFDPLANSDEQTAKCAQGFNIPSLTSWCPPTLNDIGQMAAYYKQLSLEEAYQKIDTDGWVFPNAFYIDALDYDGTIRSGSTLLNGLVREGGVEGKEKTRYAYADTVVGANVKLACRDRGEADADCAALTELVEARRAKYPAERWDDLKYGRSADWPV
ncbi:hypothetical protein TeGR_g11119 [Tetraparma gracilis]|uniref:PLC-like phosphodiesterase n=1 Tax=Tetraparma gracilis TaxID=2962635 RepID=A0ABQ6N9S8_9STRA|nr:hypothetical protein TeGR_g11119 [Tetraparma gracilis]